MDERWPRNARRDSNTAEIYPREGKPPRSSCHLGSATCSGSATFERATLVFAQPAPHPRILVGVQGVLEAVLGDRAVGADGLCAVYLVDRRSGVSHREKKLWIHCEARCFISPVQGCLLCIPKHASQKLLWCVNDYGRKHPEKSFHRQSTPVGLTDATP